MQEIFIENITANAYRIPTDSFESDGTAEWQNTTVIVVWIEAGKKRGVGITYSHETVVGLIKEKFYHLLVKKDALQVQRHWEKMVDAVRNYGLSGIAANAISAVDIALWDLKAKLLDLPLCQLWGMVRDAVPIYGSGGFTSYSNDQLTQQFENWKKLGINKFKMKVGRKPEEDIERVKNAKKVIGSRELFVDANGAYTRKQALDFAERFHAFDVRWFEEPVSSDDLEGLCMLCMRAPEGMDIAAGEYGYEIFYFKKMLEAQAVDVLQADCTRCCGFTGFFQVCDLSRSFNIPVSAHTAPSIHLHACLAQRHICHMEYFHDHVRIEEAYFEGFPKVTDGKLQPHLERPGHGLELKEQEIKQFLI